MKTLTDLLNLVTEEIELNSKGFFVNFVFDINTRYNRISFSKISPVFSEGEEAKRTEERIEVILDHMSLEDKGEIQQAYWTIYNEGRTKKD